MLKIFTNAEQTYQHIHRLQAALCLKNYVNVHWNRKSKCFEKKIQLNDNTRSALTRQICETLTNQLSKVLRAPFNEMISLITKSGMNNCTVDFVNFASMVLFQINDSINNKTFQYNKQNYDLLKTIKIVYYEKCRRQTFKNPESFKEACSTILPNLLSVWNYIYNDIAENRNYTEMCFKFSRSIDEILIYF